jgi:hypothetical protein
MRTKLRSKISLLFMTFGLVLAIPAVALADNLQDSITAGNNAKTISTGTANGFTNNYWVQATGSGGVGCDIPAGGNAKFKLNVPTGVTASTTNLTFTGCGDSTTNTVPVTFSSNTPGVYNISASYVSETDSAGVTTGAASDSYNESNANLTLTVVAAAPPPAPADTTAPVIGYTLNPASPDGSNGWYKSNVSLTWTVTENESASSLKKTGCVDQNITSDQAATTYSCSASSDGGSAAEQSVTIKRDGSAPNAPTATTDPLNPVANSGDFFMDTVTVSYGGSTDVGPSGIASYTAAETFSTSGTHSYSGTATDDAGNVSAATTGQVKVDADNPTFGDCPTAGPFLVNSGLKTVGPIDASDGESGIDSANSKLSGSVNTSMLGTKQVTFTAKDNVGHSATKTCDYNVNAHNFSGFSSPVDNPTVVNTVKAGQAIPLKWRLTDASGNPVTNLQSVTVTATSFNCSLGTSIDQIEEVAAGSSGLQNLGDGYYQYNWKSPTSYAKSCKTLQINGLGMQLTAQQQPLFQFTR